MAKRPLALLLEDIDRLLGESKRKKKMATVFVSFDWDKDKHYKFLMDAWNKNPKFDFVYKDGTPDEIDSNSVDRVKAALTLKIKDATHTLVIVGKDANRRHKDSKKIGYTNWINFEVAQSKAYGNKLVAVKTDRENESPTELIGAKAAWAMAFTQEAIIRALDNA